MKLNVFALSALLALAAAETTTTAEQSTTTTVSAEARCAKSCAANDVCCIAKCYKVPCPSDSQADDTNSCVAACPQGTGTPSDTQKYTDCQQACFSSHFFPIDGSTATGSSNSGTTASGSQATETGTSTESGSSSKGSNTASGSASGTTETGSAQTSNAANANAKLGASGAGLFGLVLAAFAL